MNKDQKTNSELVKEFVALKKEIESLKTQLQNRDMEFEEKIANLERNQKNQGARMLGMLNP